MWSEYFEYKNKIVFITAVNHAAIGITCAITIDGAPCHSAIADAPFESLKAAIVYATEYAKTLIDTAKN